MRVSYTYLIFCVTRNLTLDFAGRIGSILVQSARFENTLLYNIINYYQFILFFFPVVLCAVDIDYYLIHEYIANVVQSVQHRIRYYFIIFRIEIQYSPYFYTRLRIPQSQKYSFHHVRLRVISIHKKKNRYYRCFFFFNSH